MNPNINISNYEEFLIDFLDGTLDEATHAQVLLFLENNPDIAEEFSGIADVVVDECIGSFNHKDELKIKFESKIVVNAKNYEHYFIAYHQGDLSNDEIIQVDDFLIENTQLQNDFDLFKAVSSVKPSEVAFDEKDSLKLVEFAAGEFILKSEFENICIDYFEGNLATDTTNTLLDAIGNNKELEIIFNLYHNTKFKADKSIVFDEKAKLYRRRMIAVVPAVQYINSIAAAVVLLLMFNVYNFKLDGLNVENNISNPKNIEIPVLETPSLSENNSESTTSTTVNEAKPVDEKTVAVSAEPSIKSNTEQLSTTKDQIVYMEPKGMRAAFIREEFKMEDPKTIKYVAAAKDTSYFEVTAYESADNTNAVEETAPEEVDGQAEPTKFKRKITRIFNREKEYYASREPKQAMKKIADFAVKSYNLMTEREEPVAKN